jgi:hypothetical protein
MDVTCLVHVKFVTETSLKDGRTCMCLYFNVCSVTISTTVLCVRFLLSAERSRFSRTFLSQILEKCFRKLQPISQCTISTCVLSLLRLKVHMYDCWWK